jgi:hypothetical protein
MDPDPDPGGPKTCGSGESGFGSATLVFQWKKAGGILGTGPVCVTSYAGINGIGRKKLFCDQQESE